MPLLQLLEEEEEQEEAVAPFIVAGGGSKRSIRTDNDDRDDDDEDPGVLLLLPLVIVADCVVSKVQEEEEEEEEAQMPSLFRRVRHSVTALSGLGLLFLLVLLLLMTLSQQPLFLLQQSDRDGDRIQEASQSSLLGVSKYHKPKPSSASSSPQARVNVTPPAAAEERPDIAWLLSFPGASAHDGWIQALLEQDHTRTATNYGALSYYDNKDDGHPAIPVHPDYQCGPYLRAVRSPHGGQLALPRHYILTHTFCTDAVVQTSAVCVACPLPPINETKPLLVFERACATGNVVYEGLVRAVQYDTRLPERFVHAMENPFSTIFRRWQVTLQQQLAVLNDNDDDKDANSFLDPYLLLAQQQQKHPNEASISMEDDYCAAYVDRIYAEQCANAAEPCLGENYTNAVPCWAEFYRYIRWHNDATALAAKYAATKPVFRVWYENDTALDGIWDFLRLDGAAPAMFESRRPHTIPPPPPEALFSERALYAAARMMQEWASPATWALLHHYLDPYLHERPMKKHHHGLAKPTIPLTALLDGSDTDDDVLMGPEWGYRPAPGIQLYNHWTPPEPDDTNPQVVWLLSFPNSGTSYTINNLEETCNVTTGSNYAKDWEEVRPVRPELWPNGPFLHIPELRVPHYVLTKSHCVGYCDDCGPRDYVVPTTTAFGQGCRRAEAPNQTAGLYYDASVPVKAVHLYRNPFDNIVARMHLAVHKRERQGKNVTLFTNSREGLREWCAYLDARYRAEEETFFAPDVVSLFQDLPCHADWYRYVQWHNHAYRLLVEKAQLPTMDLFYEDYTHRYNATVQELWQFLELVPRRPVLEFFVGKSYEVFFEVEHARKAAQLVQALSLPPVWQRLKRYLEHYLDD